MTSVGENVLLIRQCHNNAAVISVSAIATLMVDKLLTVLKYKKKRNAIVTNVFYIYGNGNFIL